MADTDRADWINALQGMGGIGESAQGSINCNGAVCTVTAVSYTHLDVYKRQAHLEAIAKAERFDFKVPSGQCQLLFKRNFPWPGQGCSKQVGQIEKQLFRIARPLMYQCRPGVERIEQELSLIHI